MQTNTSNYMKNKVVDQQTNIDVLHTAERMSQFVTQPDEAICLHLI